MIRPLAWLSLPLDERSTSIRSCVNPYVAEWHFCAPNEISVGRREPNLLDSTTSRVLRAVGDCDPDRCLVFTMRAAHRPFDELPLPARARRALIPRETLEPRRADGAIAAVAIMRASCAAALSGTPGAQVAIAISRLRRKCEYPFALRL
jgi:hypothetical protein